MSTEQEIYDQRQFKLMLNIINLQKQQKGSSNYILNSLLELLDCLHTRISPEEDEKIFLLCANLEHDYLNLNDPNFSPKRKKQLKIEIEDELEELVKLIEPKILPIEE